jgi:hypothetical protein
MAPMLTDTIGRPTAEPRETTTEIRPDQRRYLTLLREALAMSGPHGGPSSGDTEPERMAIELAVHLAGVRMCIDPFSFPLDDDVVREHPVPGGGHHNDDIIDLRDHVPADDPGELVWTYDPPAWLDRDRVEPLDLPR